MPSVIRPFAASGSARGPDGLPPLTGRPYALARAELREAIECGLWRMELTAVVNTGLTRIFATIVKRELEESCPR